MAEEQGHKNEVISDADEKLGQIADMIRDAVSKFDSLSSRMDSMEERMDAGRKDAESCGDDDDDMGRKDDDEEVVPPGKPMETAADKRRKDSEESEKMDAESCDDDDDDDRKDEQGDERMADALELTRAELAAVRKQINQLQARTPAMLSDIDRERFAVIQEQADPAFQAFGDRAPAPLDGETPTQYKRRLGTKLQANSPKWANARLSAVADDAMLDTILTDVYADSIAAARRGADVQPGMLREISRQVGGHIINEFVGEPSSWMGGFVGQVKRAGGRA
jgi:hypothetical protein